MKTPRHGRAHDASAQRPRQGRALRALVLAPIAASFIAALPLTLIVASTDFDFAEPTTTAQAIAGYFAIAALASAAGVASAASLGLGWHGLAHLCGWTGWRAYAIAGAAIGLAVGAGLLWLAFGWFALELWWLGLWGGASGALAAWLAWRALRPRGGAAPLRTMFTRATPLVSQRRHGVKLIP